MTLAFDASEFHLTDSDIDRPLHGSNEPWRAAQVESKFAHPESKADSIESRARGPGPAAADEARPVLEGWVGLHLPSCGHKRMVAYTIVARMFERHESLIRRVIGRQVTRLDADFYKAVMASEPKLAARLAERARADLARYAGPASHPAGEVRDANR